MIICVIAGLSIVNQRSEVGLENTHNCIQIDLGYLNVKHLVVDEMLTQNECLTHLNNMRTLTNV